ncbi:MAG: hypothetical protein QOH27_1066 [Mycobacterium sp.]|nr:hypothetical protein [Mycobacterium sp.]
MAEREPIDRLADAARQAIEEAKTATVWAADEIDRDTYTASAMVETASRFAGIAMKSWMDLAGFALEQLGSNAGATTEASTATSSGTSDRAPIVGDGVGARIRVMSELANLVFHHNLDVVERFVDQRVPQVAEVVTDQMTSVVRRMADQARAAVDEAATQLDTEGYGPDDWARTVTKLGDIALINGIELAGSALVGPGRYETEPITSDPFTVEHANPDRSHALSVVAPLVLAGGDDVITEDRVTFHPADGVLPPGTDSFRIRVKAAGLRSGIYLGAVWAVPVDPAGAPAAAEPISEEVVPIIIGL